MQQVRRAVDRFHTKLHTFWDRCRPVEAALESIAASVGGVLGVTALNLNTGASVSLNPSQRFPMASLVKVPLAVAAMKLVDAGKVRLDQMIPLRPSHICPGGVLATLPCPGVSLSLENLISMSLVSSDNTASDALLDAIGGPAAVNRQIGDPTVTRPVRSLLTEMMGLAILPDTLFTEAMWKQANQQPYPPQRDAAIRAFFNDARDTATTGEMCQILSQIWRYDGLSRAASTFILDAMRKCVTGPRRLKAVLPTGTSFVHKTGSLGGHLTADMGIIELPSPVAVCAIIMGSGASQQQQDRVLARLGRVIHDHYSLSGRAPDASYGH